MNNSSLHVIFVLWINVILNSLPLRTISTYAELLIGAIIAQSGHITDALLAVGHQKHFTTYYWLIENAKWSWFKVIRQLSQLMVSVFPRTEWNLIIDDFICPRSSKQAPEVKFHKEHSQKPNRPQYIWGQQWVALGISLTWGKMSVCLPLLLRLHKFVGNRTKITTGLTLIRALLNLFRKTGEERIRCLVDAWYMKATFILPLLDRGIQVIGQVRCDTALFSKANQVPTTLRKKGRPRKYAKQFTSDVVNSLAIHQVVLDIYGGPKQVLYRSARCLARFLKGRPVMAVWCQFPQQTKWSLILSTDLSLTPERIIKLYARRWKIEPMFNEIKHGYGVAQAWEQTSQNVHRWVSMLCVAYSLTRMLSLLAGSQQDETLIPFIPWRSNKAITAGIIRQGLQLFFRRYGFKRLWDQKSKKLKL